MLDFILLVLCFLSFGCVIIRILGFAFVRKQEGSLRTCFSSCSSCKINVFVGTWISVKNKISLNLDEFTLSLTHRRTTWCLLGDYSHALYYSHTLFISLYSLLLFRVFVNRIACCNIISSKVYITNHKVVVK